MSIENDILAVKDLKVWFPVRKGLFGRTVGHVKALDGVSVSFKRGETLGVVGESGSGKTTLARVVAGLQKPTSGTVRIYGRIGMVFQDPLGSLNPRMTVRATLEEGRRKRGGGRTAEELLAMVGLGAEALDKYPHEFSGGQRQRICIARAVSVKPDILICDEAVSALDLQVRSQILDLLDELKKRLGLSILFITHDLGVVQHIAKKIIVMHKGRVVESGSCDEVLCSPRDPYTQRLIAAIPRLSSATLRAQ